MRKAEGFSEMIQASMVEHGVMMALANAVQCLRNGGWDSGSVDAAIPAVAHLLSEAGEWLFADGVRTSQGAFDAGLPDLSAAAFAVPYLRAGQLIAQVVAKNGIEPSDQD